MDGGVAWTVRDREVRSQGDRRSCVIQGPGGGDCDWGWGRMCFCADEAEGRGQAEWGTSVREWKVGSVNPENQEKA